MSVPNSDKPLVHADEGNIPVYGVVYCIDSIQLATLRRHFPRQVCPKSQIDLSSLTQVRLM